MRKKRQSEHIRAPKPMRSTKTGLPPGSLVYLGLPHPNEPFARLVQYDVNSFTEEPVAAPMGNLAASFLPDHVNWLMVNGIHNTAFVQTIGDAFRLHPLILEDILNTDHRPKFEELANGLFFTFKLIEYDKEQVTIASEQVSIVLGKNFVISFQENHSDLFSPILERLRQQKGKIRYKGNDYLMYTLIDLVVDNYFSVVESIEESLDELEDSISTPNDQQILSTIQQHKRTLMMLRRLIFPLREQVNSLIRAESELISFKSVKYFRDVYDHLFHISETIDNLLDINNSIKELHLSNLSLRMNQIMKLLAVFTAIFTPLTFLAGVYGMNFRYIPELEWHYGYFTVWGIWVTIVLVLVVFFKRQKWF